MRLILILIKLSTEDQHGQFLLYNQFVAWNSNVVALHHLLIMQIMKFTKNNPHKRQGYFELTVDKQTPQIYIYIE